MSTPKPTTHGQGAGPDLTSSIMKRLGYKPITPTSARTRRIRKWTSRTAFLTLVLAAIIVGSKLQSQSPGARLPVGPTIPSAINHDLTYHGATIDRAIQTIKNLSPRFDVAPVMDLPKSVPIDDQPVPVQVGCLPQQQFGWA
ncbi:MAG: hypothetical protein IH984_06790 [Planctomycetes bacterium]|nr:hypothetical protein [Planctomycetota bacterium]